VGQEHSVPLLLGSNARERIPGPTPPIVHWIVGAVEGPRTLSERSEAAWISLIDRQIGPRPAFVCSQAKRRRDICPNSRNRVGWRKFGHAYFGGGDDGFAFRWPFGLHYWHVVDAGRCGRRFRVSRCDAQRPPISGSRISNSNARRAAEVAARRQGARRLPCSERYAPTSLAASVAPARRAAPTSRLGRRSDRMDVRRDRCLFVVVGAEPEASRPASSVPRSPRCCGGAYGHLVAEELYLCSDLGFARGGAQLPCQTCSRCPNR
jgi:hypothetical protein